MPRRRLERETTRLIISRCATCFFDCSRVAVKGKLAAKDPRDPQKIARREQRERANVAIRLSWSAPLWAKKVWAALQGATLTKTKQANPSAESRYIRRRQAIYCGSIIFSFVRNCVLVNGRCTASREGSALEGAVRQTFVGGRGSEFRVSGCAAPFVLSATQLLLAQRQPVVIPQTAKAREPSKREK